MTHLRKKHHPQSVVAYYCACVGYCNCTLCSCVCSCSEEFLSAHEMDTRFESNADSNDNYRSENYSPVRDAEHVG